MFAASKTASSGVAPDPQFNYVTMLLHGDGTNGAQNNTFLDSSTNNFTITRNGNTTQGSFSPYGSNWSNYFDGTGDYLEASANSFSTSGTWTIEAWVYLTSDINYDYIVCGLASDRLYIQWAGTNFLVGDAIANNIVVNNNKPLNQWLHVAVVKNGSTYTAYFNGVSVGSSTTALTSTTLTTWQIGGRSSNGGYTKGYISNLRIVTSAVYTSNFTPSTAPLTAISGTQLLTCQSNRFIDNSTNNFAITKYGDTSVQRFNPFGASTAYSTSVIGGSGYFDGTGDYLTGTGSSNLAFGSGDFTIELWVYFNSVTTPPDYQFIYSSADSSVFLNTPVIYWYQVSSSLRFNNGSDVFSITGIQAQTWYHVAVCRSGTTTKMFLNGAQVGSATDTTVYINQPSRPMIGANGNGSGNLPFAGYISDVRCLKGTALYTSSFTPPTAPLTAITNTQLLLNCTNGAIYDNAMMNDLETVGNAQISTSVVKYGTGSIYLDGTGDWLATPANPSLAFGTAPFTLEAWVYPTTLSGTKPILESRTSASSPAGYAWLVNSSGYLNVYTNGGFLGASSSALTANVWTHVALVRTGTGTNQATYYINGTAAGTITMSGNFTDALTVETKVGGSTSSGEVWIGYIDDLRITKGYARYTTTFTPPTVAFPNTGPT